MAEVEYETEGFLVTVIYPDGEPDQKVLPQDETKRIEALKELVGGHVEVVPLSGGRYLAFYSEAKDQPHTINATATALAHESESLGRDDYIAGTAVIVPKEMLS